MRNAWWFSLLILSASLAQAQVPARWLSRGPGGGGALFAPSYNPDNPSELYLYCDMSEVFHSTDGGRSWDTVDFRVLQGGNREIYHLQFTADPAIRYALNGYTPCRSADGGASWRNLPGDPTGGGAYSLLVNPGLTNVVLTSDYGALYCSTNSGQTFVTAYQTNDFHIAGAFFDGNTVYLGSRPGLLVSTNGGRSFVPGLTTGIPAGQEMVTFAGAKQGGQVRLFCVTLTGVWPGINSYADHYGYAGIYRLDVGAGAWLAVTNGIAAGDHPWHVSMCNTNTQIVYVAGARTDQTFPLVSKSTNGGASWARAFVADTNQNVFTGWQGRQGDRDWWFGEVAIGFQVCPSDPERAAFTDFGFVHYTTNGGRSWLQGYVHPADQNPTNAYTPKNRLYHSVGLEDTSCWWLTWTTPSDVYACFTDIMGCHSTNAGVSWGFPSGLSYNSTYQCVRHPTNLTTYATASSVHDMYAWDRYCKDADLNAGSGAVLYTTNRTTGWQTLHSFGSPMVGLALHPTNPSCMYAGMVHSASGGIFVTTNLYRGTNATWSRLATPPRTQGHPYNIRVLNDGTLVCSYSARIASNDFTDSSGVFISTNGGSAWLDRSSAGMHYYVKDIVVDPHDASQRIWYAGVWGEWGSSSGHGGLYRTLDRGQSWTRITTNLRSVESCTLHPANSNLLFVTTEDQGLWYSTNARAAAPGFLPVAGYPFRFPTRVFINPYDTNEVWITSFGNGLRMGRLREPAPTFAAMAPTNNGVSLTLQAAPGQRISVQSSSNLVTWFPCSTQVVLDAVADFTVSEDGARRFYKAVVP